MTVRVGQGYDVHPYSDDDARPLVLGGVVFDGHRGLAGHSDADVVTHACIDAVLGAAGLGDIGARFPDTDATLEGADSLGLLRRAAAVIRDDGWSIGNIDCVVVLDDPKIAPRRTDMEEALSSAAGAPVTVKGKRTEGIGALGRGEGIMATAVAVVTR